MKTIQPICSRCAAPISLPQYGVEASGICPECAEEIEQELGQINDSLSAELSRETDDVIERIESSGRKREDQLLFSVVLFCAGAIAVGVLMAWLVWNGTR